MINCPPGNRNQKEKPRNKSENMVEEQDNVRKLEDMKVMAVKFKGNKKHGGFFLLPSLGDNSM
jgi:hypothetical protein